MKINRRVITLLTASIFLNFFIAPAARADVVNWSTMPTTGIGANTRVAISSTGAVMLIGRGGDGVYISKDYGNTFNKLTSLPGSLTAVIAISGDGMKIMAGDYNSTNVYTSIDQGVTWTTRTTATNKYGACISRDGSTWISSGYGGSVYKSTDNGTTWTVISALGTGTWWSCSMSDDGTKIYVLPFGGALRISADSGSTWSTSSFSDSDAYGIYATSNGAKLLQISRTGKAAYISTNYGSTFTRIYLGAGELHAAAIAGDGSKIIIGGPADYLRVSSDTGTTWSTETTPGVKNWYSFAMGATGAQIMASSTGGSDAVFYGFLQAPSTISLISIIPNSSPLIYRMPYSINVSTNVDGKVDFYANGKKIAGCIAVKTVSLNATCSYKPTIHGAIKITARLTPTSNVTAVSNVQLLTTAAKARSNAR